MNEDPWADIDYGESETEEQLETDVEMEAQPIEVEEEHFAYDSEAFEEWHHPLPYTSNSQKQHRGNLPLKLSTNHQKATYFVANDNRFEHVLVRTSELQQHHIEVNWSIDKEDIIGFKQINIEALRSFGYIWFSFFSTGIFLLILSSFSLISAFSISGLLFIIGLTPYVLLNLQPHLIVFYGKRRKYRHFHFIFGHDPVVSRYAMRYFGTMMSTYLHSDTFSSKAHAQQLALRPKKQIHVKQIQIETPSAEPSVQTPPSTMVAEVEVIENEATSEPPLPMPQAEDPQPPVLDGPPIESPVTPPLAAPPVTGSQQPNSSAAPIQPPSPMAQMPPPQVGQALPPPIQPPHPQPHVAPAPPVIPPQVEHIQGPPLSQPQLPAPLPPPLPPPIVMEPSMSDEEEQALLDELR